MKRILILMLCAISLFYLSACGAKEPIGSEENDGTTEDVFVIQAEGLDLKYPVKWKDKVSVDVTDDKVSFMCGTISLFDLLFNSNKGDVLGTVCGTEKTVINVVNYQIEDADPDLLAMQEDINVILDHLMTDYDFSVGVAIKEDDTRTFDIQTALVTLKYPEKWKDNMTIDTSDPEEILFSEDGVPLFKLLFHDCDGYLLGTYNNTPIYVIDYEAETEEQVAMQEDINVILQYLMEDSNFSLKK